MIHNLAPSPIPQIQPILLVNFSGNQSTNELSNLQTAEEVQ